MTAAARACASAPSTRLIAVDLKALDTLPQGDLGLFCWSNERPLQGVAAIVDWRLCGAISHLLREHRFSGHRQETLLLPVRRRMGPRRLFMFGLGPSHASEQAFTEACQFAAQAMQRAGAESFMFAAAASLDDPHVEQLFSTAACTLASPQLNHVLIVKK